MPRPIHKLQPRKNSRFFVVARTYCGVDPYRKGIETEFPHTPGIATCKECLKIEAEEKKRSTR